MAIPLGIQFLEGFPTDQSRWLRATFDRPPIAAAVAPEKPHVTRVSKDERQTSAQQQLDAPAASNRQHQ